MIPDIMIDTLVSKIHYGKTGFCNQNFLKKHAQFNICFLHSVDSKYFLLTKQRPDFKKFVGFFSDAIYLNATSH